MADQPVKRQTAYPCTAKQLREGTYVRREGWEPNYLLIGGGALSRVRMAGVVVQQEASQIILDDGSGNVTLRAFDKDLSSFTIGDPVLVIGRPRIYAEEKYVLIEILKRLDSHQWLKYHAQEREVTQRFIPSPPALTAPEAVPATSSEEEQVMMPVKNASHDLLGIIRELDLGDGAPTDKVLAKAGTGAERLLQTLIEEGEVFEARSGKVKVLD